MPRRISLTNFFRQIDPRYSGNNYQLLDSTECRENLFSLSSEKSQDTNEFNGALENQERATDAPIQRIIAEHSEQTFEIVYEIHHGFTSEQISVIENALLIVANRLFKPEILQNMYQTCGTSGHFIKNEVWSNSNLIRSKIYFDKYLLLQYQLMCLKTKSINYEFPTINIYPINKKSQKENNICHPCISCISHGSTFLIDGEFEIELDQHKINGSSKNSSNAIFWAGIIVYQMLRNLGHEEEDNRSQINVFKNCFLYDGFYFSDNNKKNLF